MSFIGSVNAETRKWLGNNGPAFDGRQVYVGCSGAFTVEQLLTRYAPKAKIWGNDVSLYSGVLGAYLAGQTFPSGGPGGEIRLAGALPGRRGGQGRHGDDHLRDAEIRKGEQSV